MPIRPFLDGQTFDSETTRLLGVAFELARAAIKCPRDLSDEIIARRIIELAKAGERNVEVLSEAALNVLREQSASPILLRLALHGRCVRVLHFEPIGRAAGTVGRVLPLRAKTVGPSPSMCSLKSDAGAGVGHDRCERGLADAGAQAQAGLATQRRRCERF